MSCHTCLALKSFPKTLAPYSTSQPATTIGSTFAVDVLKRWKQCIVTIRKTHHILSQLSITVRKVMTSRMEPGSPVQDTYWPCTWVGIFITRCHFQTPLYHSWKGAWQKTSTKTPSQRKRWGTWSGTSQCQNWHWQWFCISTHISPGDCKPQLTHPPRWSFCQRNMDTKGSSYWISTPICRHRSDTGPTQYSPV